MLLRTSIKNNDLRIDHLKGAKRSKLLNAENIRRSKDALLETLFNHSFIKVFEIYLDRIYRKAHSEGFIGVFDFIPNLFTR